MEEVVRLTLRPLFPRCKSSSTEYVAGYTVVRARLDVEAKKDVPIIPLAKK
jgi:hypothetical protein